MGNTHEYKGTPEEEKAPETAEEATAEGATAAAVAAVAATVAEVRRLDRRRYRSLAARIDSSATSNPKSAR